MVLVWEVFWGFSPKAQKALGRLLRAGHRRGTELSQRGTSVTQGPCDWETQGGGAGFSRSSSWPGAAGQEGERHTEVGWDTHISGKSVAYWIFWVKEKLLQPALEQMAFIPSSLEKL